MAKRHERDAWEQQLRDSQRNTVFPDTVRNEMEGYDYLLNARRLTPVQRIGSLILGPVFLLFGILMLVVSIFAPRLFGEELGSHWLGVLFIPLVLVIALFGLASATLGFRMIARGVHG